MYVSVRATKPSRLVKGTSCGGFYNDEQGAESMKEEARSRSILPKFEGITVVGSD